MKSIFIDKKSKPTELDLKSALANTFKIWQHFVTFTKELYPEVIEEWNYSSDKFGWSFRLKDKKRVLIYLLPRDKFFKVALVFGQKATDKILESSISETIKSEIRSAKVYAEGRGIRIEIRDNKTIKDIERLMEIKVKIA